MNTQMYLKELQPRETSEYKETRQRQEDIQQLMEYYM